MPSHLSTNTPDLFDLSGCITRENDYYSAHGGSADIWTGIWCSSTGYRKVAIKVLRTAGESGPSQEKLNKRLHKEILVWRMLKHNNIVPLLGITFDFGPNHPMGMVCPWLENGNLNGYLERCGATLVTRDRFNILCEVAAGLSYLHSVSVVHGDLTGSNVLIDGNGKALLTDFGLSHIIAEGFTSSFVTSSIGGSIRWAAPEHFRIPHDRCVSTVTTHSDIYSYGSVTLQALSGKLPYCHLRRDSEVLFELYQRVHPLRPPGLEDEHWVLICRCWAQSPSARPNIVEVSECVQRFLQASSVAVPGSTIHQFSDSKTLPSPDPTQPNIIDAVDQGTSSIILIATLVCAFVAMFLLHHVIT